MAPDPSSPQAFRGLDKLTLAELEAIRLVLRGGSVIDWYRFNFRERREVDEFLVAQEFRVDDPADRARSEAVKHEAMSFLRRNFEFPIPKPVASLDVAGLLELASTSGHRQLCACLILKVMHIIHHLEARELLFMLPISDQEIFHLVEEKVYRVIGSMLARGFPIMEFIGGRKHKDSLYIKLLSKPDTIAANIYDKLRFRIVTRTSDDIFPTMNYLLRHVFPFNYVIPGQSTNTIFPFRTYCESNPHLAALLPHVQLAPDIEERRAAKGDNDFSSPAYRVVQFVVDMPLRAPREVLEQAPPAAWSLGPVIFVQTEFQIIDRATEQMNELGEASHSGYKARQKAAVMRRLKVGREEQHNTRRPTKKRS